MADTKISALPASTTPLAGTEVVPLVQGGVTKQVSVANLTAGRAVSGTTFTGTNTIGFQMTAAADQDVRFALPGVADWRFRANYASGNLEFNQVGGLGNLGGWTLGGNFYAFGNIQIGTSGKGIDFSATPGTGTSELLADYEEGTWTPVVEGSTSAGTATYALQNGRYTKVGRQVYVEVALSWSGGTGTGNLTITGLPFTSANGGTVSGMSIAIADFVALTALNTMTAFVPANTTRIEAWQYPIGGGAANNVAYDTGGALYLSGSYTV